ncbi:amidase domain-containing protein [Bifidobacterium psychraerophilum]|uniref:amidase domain-containing protein n=1 Tax=Bifidobacterium psychraerophilum TaxID=218140 RepID=UPI0039E783EC
MIHTSSPLLSRLEPDPYLICIYPILQLRKHDGVSDYNPTYPRFDDNCANFVSQSIHAAGAPLKSTTTLNRPHAVGT